MNSLRRLMVLAIVPWFAMSGCGGNDPQFDFSIELTPQTVIVGDGEMFEATLTVTARSGTYANQRVQLDVVQLAGSVIDELVEGDVRGVVEGFVPVDPEMSGLGVRWKRMMWTVGSDVPSRQRDLSWVCDDGTTDVFFIVSVDGGSVNAPTGTTWQTVRTGSRLEAPVAEVIERELALTPDRELEVLPVGCGENPDAGQLDGGIPDASDGGTGDGGVGSRGRRVVPSPEVSEYGMSQDGTAFFLAGNLPRELYRVGPGETVATQVSNAAAIGAALGETVTSYFLGELTVTSQGAGVLRVQANTSNCLMLVRGDVWSNVVCVGDDLGDGPIDRLATWAVSAPAAVPLYGLVLQVRLASGEFQLLEIVDAGTSAIALERVKQNDMIPGITSTSIVEVIDNLVFSESALAGYRVKALDGTVAVYRDNGADRTLLAWADMNATAGPRGMPAPPTGVVPVKYSNGNRPIEALTLNTSGAAAWVVKFIGIDDVLLPGSGIYVQDAGAGSPRLAVDLSAPLPTPDGPVNLAVASTAVPAFQYTLLDDGSIMLNARFTEGARQGIWRVRPGAAPEPLVANLEDAPDREPGSVLGADLSLGILGPMVVGSDGAVAFTARLRGPSVDTSNAGALFGINVDGGVALLARFGDDIELSFGPRPIDLLDLGSAAVRAPPLDSENPLPGDFLSMDTRAVHVVYGTGSDGRGANFASAGCGEAIYRAAAFQASASETSLILAPLGGECP